MESKRQNFDDRVIGEVGIGTLDINVVGPSVGEVPVLNKEGASIFGNPMQYLRLS
jgi:hypothetical protein